MVRWLGVTAGVLWLVLIGFLAASVRGAAGAQDALRLLPDVVRLLRRLARDPTVPRSVRATIWCGLAYLLCPIDLVPDSLPVIGWADDAIVGLLVLRVSLRGAGPARIATHWTGTGTDLVAVTRVAT